MRSKEDCFPSRRIRSKEVCLPSRRIRSRSSTAAGFSTQCALLAASPSTASWVALKVSAVLGGVAMFNRSDSLTRAPGAAAAAAAAAVRSGGRAAEREIGEAGFVPPSLTPSVEAARRALARAARSAAVSCGG